MARTPENTRRKLLDAAREEFAQYGVAGARVNRIADSAGVNKERIYCYFGSKEGLFEAVLAEAMAELGEAVRPGEGAVGDYVGRIYDFHRRDPTLLRLLMFEALQSGSEPADHHPERAKWYRSAVDALATTGYAPTEAGPLLVTLIGLGAWSIAMPQLTRFALTASGVDEDGEASLRDFLVAFAERGAARPAAHPHGRPCGDETSGS